MPEDVLATPSEGLEARPQPPKRAIVVGSGMPVSWAGFELLRQGHERSSRARTGWGVSVESAAVR